MHITTNASHILAAPWRGRFGRMIVSGEPDGATVSLTLQKGGEYLPFRDLGVFTDATGIVGFEAKRGDVLAATVAGGGGSLAITVSLEPMPGLQDL